MLLRVGWTLKWAPADVQWRSLSQQGRAATTLGLHVMVERAKVGVGFPTKESIQNFYETLGEKCLLFLHQLAVMMIADAGR